MSPTVFKIGSFRYYFFSREENRMHIHVISTEGEAKVWIEPQIEIADSTGLDEHELSQVMKTVKMHEEEIRAKWNHHFGS